MGQFSHCSSGLGLPFDFINSSRLTFDSAFAQRSASASSSTLGSVGTGVLSESAEEDSSCLQATKPTTKDTRRAFCSMLKNLNTACVRSRSDLISLAVPPAFDLGLVLTKGQLEPPVYSSIMRMHRDHGVSDNRGSPGRRSTPRDRPQVSQ